MFPLMHCQNDAIVHFRGGIKQSGTIHVAFCFFLYSLLFATVLYALLLCTRISLILILFLSTFVAQYLLLFISFTLQTKSTVSIQQENFIYFFSRIFFLNHKSLNTVNEPSNWSIRIWGLCLTYSWLTRTKDNAFFMYPFPFKTPFSCCCWNIVFLV